MTTVAALRQLRNFVLVARLFFLLSAATSLHATIVFAVFGHDEIVVGADSVVFDGDVPRHNKMVKIRQFGSTFVSLQGNAGNDSRPFFGIIANALGKTPTIEAALKSAIPEIRTELFRYLVEIQKTQPAYFAKKFSKGGTTITSCIAVSWVNGTPQMWELKWKVQIGPAGGLGVETTGGPIARPPIGRPNWVVLGPARATAAVFENDESATAGDDKTVARIQSFFGAEMVRPLAASEPSRPFGPPLDILRITSARAEWVQRKPECPEIVPYWQPAAPTPPAASTPSAPERAPE